MVLGTTGQRVTNCPLALLIAPNRVVMVHGQVYMVHA